MSEHDPWGIQVGGIHTPGNYDARDLLEEISLDHRDRIAEFKLRHGGSIEGAGRSELFESGCRGWSEIYAVDGYVLRVEWSRFEMRGAMRILEFRPPEAGQPNQRAN
jgi:hypothetical protein